MKTAIIPIRCLACNNDKDLEYISYQLASDYSYVDLILHCCKCGSNTEFEFVPHNAEHT